jgi:flagellar basal-body rod modification protein FlgD
MASATSLLNSSGNPPASTQFPGSSSSSNSSSNQLNGNSFITLLTAQLQAQSPLNPMDPSQMVDQLAQINSLQQLIQIQSDLQTLNSAVVPGSQTTSSNSSGSSGTGM